MDNTGEPQTEQYDFRISPSVAEIKLWLVDRFRIGERQFMLVWAALIGFLGALASEGFRQATDFVAFPGNRQRLGDYFLLRSVAALAKNSGADGGRAPGRSHPVARAIA